MAIVFWPYLSYARTDYAPNKSVHTSKVSALVTRDEANTHAPFHVEVGFNSTTSTVATALDSPMIYVPSYGLNRTLHLEADFWCASTSGMAVCYLTDYTDTSISGASVTVSGSARQRKELTINIADGWRDDVNQFSIMGRVISAGTVNVITSGTYLNCWVA
jgi:hypothetical protein